MTTPNAGRLRIIALLSGAIALAGLGITVLHPAFAVDDDDWHTEADRPLASPTQTDADRDDAQPSVTAKPVRETLYAPPGLTRSIPALRFALTSYQTADGALAPTDRAQESNK